MGTGRPLDWPACGVRPPRRETVKARATSAREARPVAGPPRLSQHTATRGKLIGAPGGCTRGSRPRSGWGRRTPWSRRSEELGASAWGGRGCCDGAERRLRLLKNRLRRPRLYFGRRAGGRAAGRVGGCAAARALTVSGARSTSRPTPCASDLAAPAPGWLRYQMWAPSNGDVGVLPRAWPPVPVNEALLPYQSHQAWWVLWRPASPCGRMRALEPAPAFGAGSPAAL